MSDPHTALRARLERVIQALPLPQYYHLLYETGDIPALREVIAALGPPAEVSCEACDSGFRLADTGIHYDDARGGWTWGVCRKIAASHRADRAAAAPALEGREAEIRRRFHLQAEAKTPTERQMLEAIWHLCGVVDALRARPALSDEVLREMAEACKSDLLHGRKFDLDVLELMEFARAVLARQQEAPAPEGLDKLTEDAAMFCVRSSSYREVRAYLDGYTERVLARQQETGK